jgi:hypothetical protein
MSGYITRNALMTDNPTFGPPAQNPGWGVPNALTTATPTDAWGAPAGGFQPAAMGIRPDATGTPGLNAIQPGMSNDDLMKALAALYGGQAQPQAPTPQQQLQQAINADQANYHGREGGGLV